MSSRTLFDPYHQISNTLESDSHKRVIEARGVGYITEVLRPDMAFVPTIKLANVLAGLRVIEAQLFYQIGSSVVVAALKASNIKGNDDLLDSVLTNYLRTTELLTAREDISPRSFLAMSEYGFQRYPELNEIYSAIPIPLRTNDTKIGVGLSAAIIDFGLDANPAQAIDEMRV